jgi:hypothetical protein
MTAYRRAKHEPRSKSDDDHPMARARQLWLRPGGLFAHTGAVGLMLGAR